MIDCLDCILLETKLGAASARASRLLGEHDHQVERIAQLEHQLAELDAQRRHWIRIACGRCGTGMELCSTLAMPDDKRDAAMLSAAQQLGWWLSARTYGELGGDGHWVGENCDRDLCPACSPVRANDPMRTP